MMTNNIAQNFDLFSSSLKLSWQETTMGPQWRMARFLRLYSTHERQEDDQHLQYFFGIFLSFWCNIYLTCIALQL